MGTFSQVATLFEPSIALPTECTISRWGNRLVAITRCDAAPYTNLYSETLNLEGDSGWSTPVEIVIGQGTAMVGGDAPVLVPYIEVGKSLVLTVSNYYGFPGRDPQIISTDDGITWSKQVRLISQVSLGGAYNSFVKITDKEYGMMWYENMNSPTETQSKVWYKRVNVLTYVPEIIV
jgi:hypothetical protein